MSDKDMKDAIERSAKRAHSHTNFGVELTPTDFSGAAKNQSTNTKENADDHVKRQREHVKNADLSRNVFY